MNNRLFKLIVLVLVVVILAGAGSAFAANNTVDPSYAGDGHTAISGYKVTNVHYTLSAADPRNIASVSFTLDHPATSVQVKLVAASSTYTSCDISALPTVTCNISGVTALAADDLAVIAAE